jgi:hypothetical protein
MRAEVAGAELELNEPTTGGKAELIASGRANASAPHSYSNKWHGFGFGLVLSVLAPDVHGSLTCVTRKGGVTRWTSIRTWWSDRL